MADVSPRRVRKHVRGSAARHRKLSTVSVQVRTPRKKVISLVLEKTKDLRALLLRIPLFNVIKLALVPTSTAYRPNVADRPSEVADRPGNVADRTDIADRPSELADQPDVAD